MKNKVALFAWQDMGSANIMVPIAEEFIRDGKFETHCISSGAGSSRVTDHPFIRLENRGLRPPDFDLESYTTGLFGEVENAPVVLLGEGDWSRGATFESEVYKIVCSLNEKRPKLYHTQIQIVIVKDGWGVQKQQLQIKPKLFLTLDGSNHTHLRRYFPHSYPVVVGNHALRKVPIGDAVTILFDDVRTLFPSSKVLYYSGGHYSCTSDEIRLLVNCLGRTPGWALVYGFHPTWRDEYGGFWRALLGFLPKERVFEAPNKTGDQCATLADVTLASFSTVMGTAVYAGKTAISLYPEASRVAVEAQGLSLPPHVSLGVASLVTEPRDLTDLFNPPSADKVARLKTLDPREALQQIGTLFR